MHVDRIAPAAAGIQYEYSETPGGHEWPVWSRYLSELVPRLFPETQLVGGSARNLSRAD